MKKTILMLFLVTVAGGNQLFAQTRKSTIRRRSTVKSKTIKKQLPTKNSGAASKQMSDKTVDNQAVTTASGLTYIVTRHGTGEQLKAGQTVIVNYTGLLTNGTKFDSSLDRQEPFPFELGVGKVIKGWDEALQKLRVGDHATLIVPPAIAYGSRGAGGVIPPDATLIFIIEVVGVK